MKKHLAYYENEWPANIAELTAVENKPFVGYLKGTGVLFTVIPEPVEGPADNEIWYTSTDGNVVTPSDTNAFGANIVSNSYEDGKGVISFSGPVIKLGEAVFSWATRLKSLYLPSGIVRIEMEAFNFCQNLTDIYFNGTVEKWNSIEFGKDLNNGCQTITIHCTDGDVTA